MTKHSDSDQTVPNMKLYSISVISDNIFGADHKINVLYLVVRNFPIKTIPKI